MAKNKPPSSPLLTHLQQQARGLAELVDRIETALATLADVDVGPAAELVVSLENLEAKLDRPYPAQAEALGRQTDLPIQER